MHCEGAVLREEELIETPWDTYISNITAKPRPADEELVNKAHYELLQAAYRKGYRAAPRCPHQEAEVKP